MSCSIFLKKEVDEEVKKRKFTGGNYIASTTNDTAKIWPAFKQRLNAHPEWDGVALRYDWTQLERNEGEYEWMEGTKKCGLLDIDEKLDELQTDVGARKLLLLVTVKTFGGSNNHSIPADMRTAAYGDQYGGSGEYAYASANLGAGGNVPKMYLPSVRDRFVALLNAIAARYDNDDRFEAIMFNELSIAKPASLGSAGWPQEGAWFNNFKEAILSARPSFARTNIMQWINAPRSAMKDIVPAFREAGIGIGLPDLCFRTKGFWFNPIDHPTAPPGSFWHCTQSKGKVPIVGHVSNPALDGCCAAAGQDAESASNFTFYVNNMGFDSWPAFNDSLRFSGGGTPYQTKQFIHDKSVEFLGVTHLLWAHSTMQDIGGGGTKAQTVDAWISNPENNIATSGRPAEW